MLSLLTSQSILAKKIFFLILKSINFDKVDITCFLIENNYGISEETEFLKQKGYSLTGNIQWDCVFVKNNYNNG